MFLGIDLGSTFFKVELVGAGGARLGSGAATVPYLAAGSGRMEEIPVDEAESALARAVRDALSGAGVSCRRLAAIGITSQAQTFTVRAPSGAAKRPFLSWRESRIGAESPALDLPDFGRHTSFPRCVPALTVAKVAQLQRESGRHAVEPGDALRWLPTWFVERAAGRAVVDANLAAMSGLYSLELGGWWPDALACCGLAAANLPAHCALGAQAGATTSAAAAFGLPAGVPVFLAGNDQTAGAYAAGIHDSQSVFISLGTAQVAYACMPTMPEAVDGMIRGPYPGGRWYRLFADSCGSGTVAWARAALPGLVDVQAFDAAAAQAPAGCHGVRFVVEEPTAQGRWIGLDAPGATIADAARAVFETLVERLARGVERLGAPADRPRRLLLAGGGASSAPWRQMLADRLGAEAKIVPGLSAALGAAKIAEGD